MAPMEPKNRQFKYSEVQKMTNNFERVLGKGGFGTVFHGYLDDTQGYKQFQAEVYEKLPPTTLLLPYSNVSN